MVELINEKREVFENTDGSIKFVYNQEVQYDRETVNKMIIDWEEDVKNKKSWLNNFDKVLETTLKEAEEKLKIGKTKFEKEVENLEEAIKLWSNIKKIEDQ